MEMWQLGNDFAHIGPFQLIVLASAGLSLCVAQLDLPGEYEPAVGMWQRGTVLLVGAMVLHHLVSTAFTSYQEQAKEKLAIEKSRIDVKAKGKMAKVPNAWENPSAHPSAFLTTKDGKPRLFPFPLGKAGAGGKEMWWEAGNSSHVGHFNQRELPEAKEALRLEMEEKEEKRVSKAKKKMEEMEGERAKWLKRLANLKLVCGIVVIGLFHRTAAVLCLAALMYYIVATEFGKLLKAPEKDDDEMPSLRRKKIPMAPGMGMTYLYEPGKNGAISQAGAIPLRAPTNRLLTSGDSRYAS